MKLRAATFAAAVLVLWGCTKRYQIATQLPAEPLKLTTAFVYPFAFRWEEPAYRRYELSQRLVQRALETRAAERLAFYGPGEVHVKKGVDEASFAASDALQLLMVSGQKADQGIVIRPWAERRVSTSVQEITDKKGRASGASGEETEYVGHVEVLHPSTHQTLVEVSGTVKVDVFAAPHPDDEFDPARALTELMLGLTAEALDALGPHLLARPVGEDPGLTLVSSPKLTLQYQDDESPALDQQLLTRDPLAGEVARQNRARFLAPWLPEDAVGKVSRLPAGVWVAAAPSSARVQPGDTILTIDGEPARPQHLHRLRFTGVPASCRVKKASGEETDVSLP